MKKCKQCLKEKPEAEMRQVTIIQQRYDSLRRQRQHISSDKMWFCKDTPCAGHYQMGCEG